MTKESATPRLRDNKEARELLNHISDVSARLADIARGLERHQLMYFLSLARIEAIVQAEAGVAAGGADSQEKSDAQSCVVTALELAGQ